MRRAPVRRELDEDKEKRQYQARFEPELWGRMVRYKEETGMNYMEQITRGLDLFHQTRGAANETATGKHLVSFEFNEQEMEKLREVAGTFNLPETNWFARMLVLTNLAHPLDELRAFLFAPLQAPADNGKGDGGESDKNHTSETGKPSKASKTARKVA